MQIVALQDKKNRSLQYLDKNKGVIWRVANNKEPLLIHDVSKVAYYEGSTRKGSELAVPIFYRQNQEIFGVLNIEYLQKTNVFSQDDVKLAEAISSLISVVLDTLFNRNK